MEHYVYLWLFIQLMIPLVLKSSWLEIVESIQYLLLPHPVHPSNQFPKYLSSTSTAFPPFNLSSIPAVCISLRPSLLPYLPFRNKAVIGFFTSISLHSDPSHTPWRHSSFLNRVSDHRTTGSQDRRGLRGQLAQRPLLPSPNQYQSWSHMVTTITQYRPQEMRSTSPPPSTAPMSPPRSAVCSPSAVFHFPGGHHSNFTSHSWNFLF